MFKVVIPARYASARLPGKPLLPLAGKPMLQWVYERACAAQADEVLIATDDERIAATARAFAAGAAADGVVMTSAAHASGTDRVAEVARRRGWDDRQIVVNVQGDEPLLPPQLIRQVAALLEHHPGADIATLATPIGSVAEYLDPNVVKVVADSALRALYFSRAPIPWHRDGVVDGGQAQWQGARRHVGLYAYRVAALRRLAALPPSPLEVIEKLEQLRALEAGCGFRVADGVVPPGPDVNTPADLERVAALLVASGVAVPAIAGRS
ncbi:MAG: 3-deoxy-manno-octulosonate cytidylyltransferase [Gammaproteobacteria bacterium]|nr:3-deoxy-manno-octulosonate cytidylyltransferase [Gammaproteobacteria bacterium]MDE2251708.1 3-deoxy-manno-octulosonate cytidylyltransferase [Gammaproteobacteria bacterium]